MQTLFSGSLESLSWLINYTMDVSILICLIFVIKFIAGKRLPAWWGYCLWLLLLVRMFIPWRIENQLNISNLLPVEMETDILRLMLTGMEIGTIDLTATASSGWWQGWNLSLDQKLMLLWLAGAAAFGIFILVKNTSFWIMIKRRGALTEKRTLDLLEECKNQLDIHRDIDVIITDKVKSPALFGYFHPRLLLPEGILEDFSDEELAYVFMHELGHLKRHDIAVTCLMTLFQVIHWFNLLVWLAFYQMRIDQESACDSSVLSRLRENQSVEYANAIVGFLERYCQNRQLPCMAGILENKTQMKRRLTMIINYKRLSSKRTVMAVSLLITTGFFFFTLTGFAKIQDQVEIDQTAQQVLKDADEALQANNYSEVEKTQEAYIVAREGNVEDVVVEKSEPEGVFDQTALDAIEQDVLKLGNKGGEPVDVFVQAPTSLGTHANIKEAKLNSSLPSSQSVNADHEYTSDSDYTGEAYGLAEIDTPPQVLRLVPPQYPFIAKRDNIEGRVVLRFVVTKEGVVREPEVIESEPAGIFDEAALAAIEQYFFKPATIYGEPVNCIVNAPMKFTLE